MEDCSHLLHTEVLRIDQQHGAVVLLVSTHTDRQCLVGERHRYGAGRECHRRDLGEGALVRLDEAVVLAERVNVRRARLKPEQLDITKTEQSV